MRLDDDVNAMESSIQRFLPKERKEKTFLCQAYELEDCPRRTSDNKPWCVDHIERMPYARDLMSRLATMSPAEVLGPPDPYPLPQDGPRRRRTVVPLRFQVGRTRFWVALVRSRGVEEDPEFAEPENPRMLDSSFHAEARPFTLLLTRDQSKYVLLALQYGEAERIPREWLVDDDKVVEDLHRRFSTTRREELEREAEACRERELSEELHAVTEPLGLEPEAALPGPPDGDSPSSSA